MNKKWCLLILLYLGLFYTAFAQKDSSAARLVEILQSEEFELFSTGEKTIKRLKGNVRIKHDEMLLNCDSADLIEPENIVKARGNVRIDHGDTMRAYCDSLQFDKDENIAQLLSNVKIINKNMTLTTEHLTYKVDERLGYYVGGGKLINNDNVLTSKVGYYNVKANTSHFRGDVHLVNPDYTIDCDTLVFNNETEVAYFYGPTTLTTDENEIYCEKGWYNSKSETSKFTTNAWIQSPDYLIKGDTLNFNNKTGFGKVKGNVEWSDSTKETIITGHYAEYNQKKDNGLVTDSALLTIKMDDDTLYLTADSLFTHKRQESTDSLAADSSKETHFFYAYNDVTIYKSNMQAVCDSLTYFSKDSVFNLYKDPVVWTDSTQMTADTISLFLQSKKIKKLSLLDKAFIINFLEYEIYNQIKGRDVFGYFEKDTLRRIIVKGNGESIYYAQDDNKAYIGANKATCSNILIKFKDAKVNTVTFLNKPNATFFPMQQLSPATLRFDGFSWQEHLRPKSKADLFKPRKKIAEDKTAKAEEN